MRRSMATTNGVHGEFSETIARGLLGGIFFMGNVGCDSEKCVEFFELRRFDAPARAFCEAGSVIAGKPYRLGIDHTFNQDGWDQKEKRFVYLVLYPLSCIFMHLERQSCMMNQSLPELI
jgi:hypothetical protein